MHETTHRSAALRTEVGRLRARESRRIFDTSIVVGLPGQTDRASFVVRARDEPAVDAALRTDVLCRLLEQRSVATPVVLVIRAGMPTAHDIDLQWLAAADMAFGVHGEVLNGFYAITRAGWLDVRTGERRTWARLRL